MLRVLGFLNFLLFLTAVVGVIGAAGTVEAARFKAEVVKVPGGVGTLHDAGELGVVVMANDGAAYTIKPGGGNMLVPLENYSPPPLGHRPGMLPDGIETRGSGKGKVAAVWLTGPSRRYGHGILGDSVEATGIHVEWVGGGSADYILPDDSVFEDRLVRLADMDGDGEDELIAIRTYLESGSALMVLKADGRTITPLAETEPIGRSYRWLSPLGVADFDADGKPEVALITTPHIGGTLRVYGLRDGKLRQEIRESGFSNHFIGSRVLDMALVLDLNADEVPDMLVPDDARTKLKAVTVNRGETSYLWEVLLRSPIITSLVAKDLANDGLKDVIFGLGDGTLVLLQRVP